jgi:hypothetical protein
MALSVGGRRKATYLFGFGLKNDSDREAVAEPDESVSVWPPEAATVRPSRRAALAKESQCHPVFGRRELDWLLRTAFQEAKRRGRPMPMTVVPPTSTPAPSSVPIPKHTRPPHRQTRQQQVGLGPAALTQGQVNAVRAAFKVRVTPSRIARQFGLTLSQVRKAFVPDEPRR